MMISRNPKLIESVVFMGFMVSSICELPLSRWRLLLGASFTVISRGISRITIDVSHHNKLEVLICPRVTTHEPQTSQVVSDRGFTARRLGELSWGLRLRAKA